MDSGRHSKHLTQTLAAKYQEARNDPELMAHRDDLALIEARIEQLLERTLGKKERPEAWAVLRQKMGELTEAAHGNNTQEIMKVSIQIDKIFDDVEHDYLAWNQIFGLMEERRKIGESEQKRLIAMKQMIKVEDATKLIAQLLAVLKKHLLEGRSPKEIWASISYEYALIAGDLTGAIGKDDSGRGGIGSEPDGEADRSGGMDTEQLLDP